MASISSLLIVLVCVPSLVTAAGGTCKTFTANSSPESTYRTIFDPPITVSNSVSCNGSALGSQFPPSLQGITRPCNSTECAVWIPVNYDVEMHARLNLTSLSNDTQDNILQLIQDHVGDKPGTNQLWADFNRTIVRPLSVSMGVCVREGPEGHYILTPYYLCTNGTLSGCSGDDALAENTPVRACGIELLQGRSPNGVMTFLQGGNGENLPPPPNATATPSSGDTSGASRFRGAEFVGPFLGLGAVFMLLL